jgi:hypothetical protein
MQVGVMGAAFQGFLVWSNHGRYIPSIVDRILLNSQWKRSLNVIASWSLGFPGRIGARGLEAALHILEPGTTTEDEHIV